MYRRFEPRLLVSLLTLSVAVAINALAQNHPQFAGDDRDTVLSTAKLSQLPLQALAECDRHGVLYRMNTLTITAQASSLLIAGHDNLSHAWRAEIPVNGLGCSIFTADLARNGQRDLAIYTPGIGDRGRYGSTLTLLLFDQDGSPIPWQATGRFTVNPEGIEEIKQTTKNEVWIVHTQEIGLPAWDGLSYVTSIYNVTAGGITPNPGVIAGLSFPHISSATPTDARLAALKSQTEMASNSTQLEISAQIQPSAPTLVPAPKEPMSFALQNSENTVSPDQGTHLAVNANALGNTGDAIFLSDGTKLDYPSILIVQSTDQSTEIVFHPDGEDFQKLRSANFRIRPIGKDCYDLGECQPFIIRAVVAKTTH